MLDRDIWRAYRVNWTHNWYISKDVYWINTGAFTSSDGSLYKKSQLFKLFSYALGLTRWAPVDVVLNSILQIKLTHWGRVTHICVSKLTTIGSNNGLSPGRRQAIIWTNDGILLIRTLGTNFSEILSEIHSFSLKKNAFENVVCEMASIFVSASMS